MVAPLLVDGLCAARKQQSGHENLEIHNIRFADKQHMEFYNDRVGRLNPDCYLKALIYTLGICPDTRRRFDSLYDAEEKVVVPEMIHCAWQTGSSLNVTRFAFHLFTGGTPSAYPDPGKPDFDECARYSVSSIFCCSYAPYFVEAIKLRYPEYMRGAR